MTFLWINARDANITLKKTFSVNQEVKLKRAIMNDCLFPRFAVLDPTKTYTLRLGGYGIKDVSIKQVIDQLQAHGMMNMGENKDVTLDMMRTILKLCL